MDKKSLAILLVVSSMVSPVFAANTINKFIVKHGTTSSSMVKSHKSIKKTNHAYTDFSGAWMVNCGDGSPSVATVIENDAYYIKLDGAEFRIGQGLTGESQTNESYTSLDNTSIEWNEDGASLNIKSVNLYKSNTDNSAIETDISQANLTMNNGQINLDGKLTIFEDTTQTVQSVAVHCVFVKKQ